MSEQQREAGRALGSDGEEIQNIGYESVALEAPLGNHAKAAAGRESVKQQQQQQGKERLLAEVSSSSASSQNDICRICHMGCRRSASSASSASANLELGQLVSACRCRGSVGLVHTGCLERWLTESGHTRCELCGYRYATIRVPRHGLLRSLLVWMKSSVATRQMLLDSLYLLVTTPLAVFSAYVCAITLKMALDNRIAEIPWTIVAMLPTCSLTLVAYWGWLLTLQRLHGRRWRQYWRNNFVVQLVTDAPVDDAQPGDDLDFYQDDLYDDLPELFNLI